ncbi:MAG: endonuclease domain-containing protein [Paludibacteraceae bacterium]|nr:endonuclease domain-containing protein [Paludibacteraceae bacterium]MBR0064136.1 endonuclease domain-containing protein [Paludibacteraceae bacterium]
MAELYNTADPMLYGVLKENARKNKKYLTEAESILWDLLRRKQLGVIFRRQYIIDAYIVDFVCLSKQLIIEVDGKYHDTAEQQQLDKQRENRLQKLGFTVLRFNNEEVVACPEKVIEKIKQYIV